MRNDGPFFITNWAHARPGGRQPATKTANTQVRIILFLIILSIFTTGPRETVAAAYEDVNKLESNVNWNPRLTPWAKVVSLAPRADSAA